MRGIESPFIIDVEASGMGPDSYPIEVGLALTQEERYCSLITPSDTWTHWDNEAERLHKISRELLIQSGKSVKDVALELNEILEGKFVFSDGWVVDEPWLLRLFAEARIEKKFRVYDLQTILTEEQMALWHEVKDQVIEDLDVTRHRASNDAFVIQETFRRTRESVKRKAS